MLGYKIIYSALQIGFPYFHGLRLSSEPARAKNSGTDGHQPKKSTADAPQRGQVEFAFCLPTSGRSLRKSIDIRPEAFVNLFSPK